MSASLSRLTEHDGLSSKTTKLEGGRVEDGRGNNGSERTLSTRLLRIVDQSVFIRASTSIMMRVRRRDPKLRCREA